MSQEIEKTKKYAGCIHAVATSEGCVICDGVAPQAEAPTIKMGFHVEVKCHTKEAERAITSPEALRFQIGHMMDSWGIQEEIDYTLEVKRSYEQI